MISRIEAIDFQPENLWFLNISPVSSAVSSWTGVNQIVIGSNSAALITDVASPVSIP